jgi:adenine-specific DNA-methyltransferase
MQSYKHKSSTRPLIPSKEEAGMEESAIQNRKSKTELPLNPVTQRGQDPELYWMNKYGPEDSADTLEVDIRSLYRHEHISPELLIRKLYRQVQDAPKQGDQLGLFAPDVREIFGNTLDMDEFEKVGEYYRHQGDWSNRLIQGDSLLTMTSLLEREGFAGKVQMIYFDPPYGIKYKSNWQIKLGDRTMPDSDPDEALSSEPEQIKAFRDTWELGIHSYLTYLRDRLLVARELLTESGSCFVQISDENVHLVRCLMDEVFGSGNFVGTICFKKTAGKMGELLDNVNDYIVWYGKSKENLKYNQLYDTRSEKSLNQGYTWIELTDGTRKRLTSRELSGLDEIPDGRRFITAPLISQSGGETTNFPVDFEGKIYKPSSNTFWKTNEGGLNKLMVSNRIIGVNNTLAYVRYEDDFPVVQLTNFWADTQESTFAVDKRYVVQTAQKVIQRCLLMTTDPGDLVLDPTCGSGTTAYVAEQWGRRWITLDTSRIALNIAKTRLMTAVFPYYHLYSNVQVETSEKNGKIVKKITPKQDLSNSDVRQGFVYEEVPHITLKSLANDEPPATETLYDKPYEDKSRLRVAGPFTVETLQNYEPLPAEDLHTASDGGEQPGASATFEERVFEHLKATGVMNGAKNERAVFRRVERIGSPHLHAEGYFQSAAGERKAYLHIGPQFGTVSKQSVNEAVKECRSRGDADWLIILGFSFESDISNQSVTMSMGSFEVTKVRMHDDLLQEGLTKKDKKAASFVTIGEPDVVIAPIGDSKTQVQVEIQGLDIYDPIRDEVRARSVSDIAYWMVDDDYDGSNFIVRQVFFCGGDKDEFSKWKRGLSDLAKQQTKKNAERTLRVELDEEAFDLLYGFRSHPIERKAGRKIAVRVVSQFGEESMKVLNL